MTEVVVEVGEFHHSGEFARPTRSMGNPADVFLVRLGRCVREQFERQFFDRRQAVCAERFSPGRREFEQLMQPRHRLRGRCDRVRDVFDVFHDRVTEPSALSGVTEARHLLSDSWIHQDAQLSSRTLPQDLESRVPRT